MSVVRNYQKELDKITEDIKNGSAPTLFLHSCCAPCSSYVLEYLRQFFRITVFYYNPNITEAQEYRKRVAEQKRLIAAYNAYSREAEQAETGMGQEQNKGYLIDIVEGDYEPASMRSQKDWSSVRRAGSGALPAMRSGCRRRQNVPGRADMIILQLR